MQPINYSNLIQRWYNAADPRNPASTSDLNQLVNDTKNGITYLEYLKENNLTNEIKNISSEILQKFDKHGIGESQLLAKLIGYHSCDYDKSLNIYKTIHKLFQIVAKSCESSPEIFNENLNANSNFDCNLLSIMNIDAQSVTYINHNKNNQLPITQMKNMNVESLIDSYLDDRSLKALKIADSGYKKRDLIIKLNQGGAPVDKVNIYTVKQKVNIYSIKQIVDLLGDHCVEITRLTINNEEDIETMLDKFPNLEHLTINCKTDISNKGAQNLSKLNKLISLNFILDLKNIKNFNFLKSITNLKNLNKDSINKINQLKTDTINKLNQGEFFNVDIIKQKVDFLVYFLGDRCKEITRLTIHKNEDIKTVLDNFPNIENLTIDIKKDISDEDAQNLSKLTKLVNLSFSLSCNKIKNFSFLKSLTNLQNLNLEFCKIRSLKDCPSSLICLNISNTGVKIDSGNHLVNLKTLVMQNCINKSVDFENCRSLEYLIFTCESETIDLKNLDKCSLKYLTLKCNYLRKLELKNCEFLKGLDLSDCTYLREINVQNCPSLENLDISGCENIQRSGCKFENCALKNVRNPYNHKNLNLL